MASWQDRVDPIWNYLTGDCHINRHTEEVIEEGGFEITNCIRESIPKAPQVAASFYPAVSPCLPGGAKEAR